MLRKCEDIRNEGIDGVLPTTGSTPSSTAKGGLAASTDEALAGITFFPKLSKKMKSKKMRFLRK